MKDLHCSKIIFYNDYPQVTLKLDFNLFLVNETNEQSINCKEYEIRGIHKNDIYCYLRYQIIQGQTQNFSTEEKILSIEDINVNEDFRRQGLAINMYQLFSYIYVRDYAEYKITRKFVNPHAEFVFRKAVQDNKVDKTLLQNSVIKREYDASQKEVLRNLMEKLSPEFRATL